jgi:hypothetical protein
MNKGQMTHNGTVVLLCVVSPQKRHIQHEYQMIYFRSHYPQPIHKSISLRTGIKSKSIPIPIKQASASDILYLIL